jgi:hypothetical protein
MPNNIQEHTLLEIQRIQQRTYRLESLLKLSDWKNVRIVFEAKDNLKQEFVIIDQFDFPFNLVDELRLLITDSINHNDNDIATLNFKLKID